jgi:molybdopterin-guanine dinucleotide biosynthesis protein A
LTEQAPQVLAIILAGGEGQRLGGVIKANIEIDGKRLLLRVAEALAACDRPMLVSHGRIDPELLALPAGFQPVPDLASDYRGPLAGLAGAIGWLVAAGCSPEFIVTAAVDTPFLPPDFVGRAIASITAAGANAVIARYADQDCPTSAIWRFAAVKDLADRVLQGSAPHSLRRLGVEVAAPYLDWPTDAAGDPFANINTPEELHLLSARAGTPPSRR